MDSSYPVFPVFALLGFILVLVPLPWHLQALNSGTCLFMVWTAVACLNQFVNSIVWHGNIVDRAPVWCDISTRLMVGISVAIPAASLCINRRLYKIATCHTANITHAHKVRAVLVDLSIGLGIPALQMILQFVVQGHRYDIWEDIGCLPTTVNTPPAYPLSFLWPNVISLVSAVYCMLTLRAFMLRRAQFNQFISSRTSLSVNHYFRLMSLATTEILFTIPISSYGLYLNATSKPIYPWISWSDIHFDWYTIDTFPAAIWRTSRLFTVVLELNRWSPIMCAFIFFGFFGFAEEARKNYYKLYRAVTKRLGVELTDKKNSSFPQSSAFSMKKGFGTPPKYTPQDSSQLSPTSPGSFHSTFTAHSNVSSDVETLAATPLTPHSKFDLLKSYQTSESRLSRATI